MTWFSSPISNRPAEGFTSRIQRIKPAARGFRIFEPYRIRILSFCGELSLKPGGNLPQKSLKNFIAAP
ncbi:MAG: transposase [Planctomycetaceae bacterium]